MKVFIILFLGLFLSIGLINAQTVSNKVSIPKIAKEINGHGLKDISSHIFGIEGEVTSVEKTKLDIKSITIRVIKPLPTAVGWVPYGQPGEIATIRFDEPISRLRGRGLKSGTFVKVNFGTIDNTDKWGSNFSWLYIKRNSAFYDADGNVVENDPPISGS